MDVSEAQEPTVIPTVISTTARKPRLALSFDIEATGDAPGRGSMVMLGITAVLEDQPDNIIVTEDNPKEWIVAEKEWCLEELDGRGERCWDNFWVPKPELWNYIQKLKIHPTQAMQELNLWLKELSLNYSWFFVARPAAFDWQWLNHSWVHYGPPKEDRVAFPYKADCMGGYKTTWALLGNSRKDFDDFVTPTKIVLTHNALEDARSQAYEYLRMRDLFKCYAERFTLLKFILNNALTISRESNPVSTGVSDVPSTGMVVDEM